MSIPMLSPTLMVKDMGKTLGFENTFKMPDPDGNLIHANVVWKNVHIMFGPTTWLPEDVVP